MSNKLKSILKTNKLPVIRIIKKVKSEKSDDLQALQADKAVKKVLLESVKFSPTVIRIVPSNCKNVSDAAKQTKSPETKSPDIPSTSNSEIAVLDNSINSNNDVESNDFEEVQSVVDPVDVLTDEDQKMELSVASSESTDTTETSNQKKKHEGHSDNCCDSCRNMLEKIVRQQEDIIGFLKNGHFYRTIEKRLDLLPPMPFVDINDFLDFDESLMNENVQSQFIIKVRKLLVGTEQKSISNIMASIVTNELCRTISWIGIKNTVAFGTTTMVGIIVDIIQDHHQVDMNVIKARIAEWLRRCGDRIGNEIRKIKKKEQLTQGS